MDQLSQALTQGLVFGSIYAIAALGFALVYNTTVIFHVAYGAIANVGVLLAISAHADTQAARLIYTVPLGMAVAAACGALLYLAVYRVMQRRGANTITIFVASLGANLTISSLLQVIYGPALRHFQYTGFFRTHHVLSVQISDLGVVCIASGVVCVLVIAWVIRRSGWGQQVRAVGSSAEMAELAGIRTVIITSSVLVVSSVIAVASGVLLGLQTSVAPPVDPTLTLLAAVAVLLAGRGSYVGAYVCGLLLGVVEALAGSYAPGQWARASVFAVFVLVVLVRPQGLLARRLA